MQTQNETHKKLKWTSSEDQTLLKLAFELGEDWLKISERFSHFKLSASYLKEYYEKLKAQILSEKRRFTVEEDEKILKYYKKCGAKWHIIASKLERRTAASIKNRFYSNLRYRVKKPLLASKKNSKAVVNQPVQVSIDQTLPSEDPEVQTSPQNILQDSNHAIMPSENWTIPFLDVDQFFFFEENNDSSSNHDLLKVEDDEDLRYHQPEYFGDDDFEPKKKLKTESASAFEHENFMDIHFPEDDKKPNNEILVPEEKVKEEFHEEDQKNSSLVLLSQGSPRSSSSTDQESQKASSQDKLTELNNKVNTLFSSMMSLYNQIQSEFDKVKEQRV